MKLSILACVLAVAGCGKPQSPTFLAESIFWLGIANFLG